MPKKEQLIKALETENIRLGNTTDHRYALEYLRTGKIIPNNPAAYMLLDACINDLETMFIDYDCEQAAQVRKEAK